MGISMRENRVRWLLIVGVLLVATFSQNCSLPSKYSVTLQNETSVRLTDVRVTWNEYIVTAGNVSPRTGKTEAFPDAPFPTQVLVVWRTPEGDLHEVIVDVAAHLGKRSRWANVELIFSISEDEIVKVTLEKGLA